MKHGEAILHELKRGAATSNDLERLLKIPRSELSPYLSRLHERGRVQRVKRIRDERGRPEFVYFLPGTATP